MLKFVNKYINSFALLSCGVYLVANIYYDLIDIPCDYNCPTALDGRVVFIPMSFMVFALILKCMIGATRHKGLWSFFFWLSVGQLTKMCLFNPFLQTLNDYVYLACVAAYIIHQFVKSKK